MTKPDNVDRVDHTGRPEKTGRGGGADDAEGACGMLGPSLPAEPDEPGQPSAIPGRGFSFSGRRVCHARFLRAKLPKWTTFEPAPELRRVRPPVLGNIEPRFRTSNAVKEQCRPTSFSSLPSSGLWSQGDGYGSHRPGAPREEESTAEIASSCTAVQPQIQPGGVISSHCCDPRGCDGCLDAWRAPLTPCGLIFLGVNVPSLGVQSWATFINSGLCFDAVSPFAVVASRHSGPRRRGIETEHRRGPYRRHIQASQMRKNRAVKIFNFMAVGASQPPGWVAGLL
ncbi:uncharacterized protein LY79DRAFT_269799 [Colletotrichum navitas]|uniref:Uncharacterized protein n=1 Tax=Colletotrichum navitas TaxID=681940 RepID=A0AAD8PV69_9PEZI|nr:uncharacterized protein LY79DRAFT_269799 [Colletotrichum navitas]KAK1585304.1 hypothetical protein LY79DRAFT_269799 [Colletotrichum navitas]